MENKKSKDYDYNWPGFPSRWKSPLFIIHVLIFFFFYFNASWTMINRRWDHSIGRVKPGWFFGMDQDLTDLQWLEFRTRLPIIVGSLSLFLAISWIIKRLFTENRKAGLMSFYCWVGIFAQILLHGATSFFSILIALINFAIGHFGKAHPAVPWITWALNLFVLVSLNWWWNWASLWNFLGFSQLTNMQGFVAWSIFFKMTFLRQIAFNMDRYWAFCKRPPYQDTKTALLLVQEKHCALSDYSLNNYFGYLFYFPLYLAGPISNFNSFCHQVQVPQQTYSSFELVKKGIWTACIIAITEIYLHLLHCNAFNSYPLYGWNSGTFTPLHIVYMVYFTTMFMYLKFLSIWRLFSFAALVDGIETWENMNRCVSNNYTFTGFWRGWHGSLNKWILRYLYVPCGGAHYRGLIIWPIFMFIGLWHELKPQWLAWALLNCFFFSIEILLMMEFNKKKYYSYWVQWWWQYFISFVGLINVYLLLLAQIAIFHGFTATWELLVRISDPSNFIFVILAIFPLSGSVSFMIEIRETERRYGKDVSF